MLIRRALDPIRLSLLLFVLLLIPACSYDQATDSEAEEESEIEIQDQSADEQTGDEMVESLYEMLGEETGITMIIPEDTLYDGGTTITVTNDSSYTCTFGTYYCLETEIDGIWYSVPFEGDEEEIGWDDLGYEVGPRGEQFSLVVDWEWLYGDLEPGRYRMVKDLFYNNDWQEKYYVAAEFEIQ